MLGGRLVILLLAHASPVPAAANTHLRTGCTATSPTRTPSRRWAPACLIAHHHTRVALQINFAAAVFCREHGSPDFNEPCGSLDLCARPDTPRRCCAQRARSLYASGCAPTTECASCRQPSMPACFKTFPGLLCSWSGTRAGAIYPASPRDFPVTRSHS